MGANLQAAQGNLASALDQVDRAVAQRFDPVKEEIAVKKANLDLILDSPEASLADKKRAQKQKETQDAKLRQIEIQEREQDTIWKTGVEAAQNGADALTLRKIQQAKTAGEAAQIAAPFLKKEEKPTGDIAEFKAFFPNVDITTPAGQQQFLNWKAKTGAAGRSPEAPIVPGAISEVTGKPLTEGERISRGFAERAVISSEIIDQIGPRFAGLTSYLGQTLPNILKTSDRQRFEQAQRNFVNAILRRESGAVINPDEFVNARKQYFPQPGDKPEVITQKARNREVMIRTLQSAGGILPFSGTSGGIPEDLRNKYKY